MGFDTHRFGSYLATDAAHNRLPYAFDWSWPVMTAGYRAHLQAGLEPEKYADELWELSRHTLTIGWYDLDTAALVAAINEAIVAIAPTVRWYVTAAGTSDTYSCLIRDVEHSEAYEVDVDGRRGTAVDFILTCTPGWEASEVEVALASPTTYPCVYTASGLLGSMPAPFRLVLTNDQAVTGGTLGFRHMPDTAFSPLQDYQGTEYAAALSGQAAEGTMDADGTALGTPATLDTNAMRGWYYACARLSQPDTTPADTTYKAVSTVTGSGMGGTQSSESDAVAATAANVWEHVRLGPVPIPGGAVPDITTGAGSEPVSVGNAADEGTLMLYSDPVDDYEVLQFQQTFKTFGGNITSIEYTIDVTTTAPNFLRLELALYDETGSLQWEGPVDHTVGTHVVTLPAPIPVVSGEQWYLAFETVADIGPSEYSLGFAHSNGDYADGELVMYMGSGASAGDDLTFAIHGTVPLGFNSTVGIIAANAGGGSAALDTVALVPADEFALLADTAHGTNEGMMVDAMDPDEVTVYGTNTTGGVEPADQEDVEYTGVPRIWPGTTAIVYDAHTPQAATPLAGDAKLWYKPTYRTPYGA